MGLFSSVFGSGSSGSGWEAKPDTEEKKKARNFLVNLLDENIVFPTKQVPGLSGLERESAGMIRDWMGTGTPAGVTAATNELTKTVKGGYDPVNSMAYKGYRDASKLEEASAINAMKRGMQIRGMNASSPEVGKEGRTRRGYSADRMGYLGQMYENERGRQTAAAPILAGISTQTANEPARKAQAGAQFGMAERMIETAQEEALYEAAMRTLLAPYYEKLNVAGTLINEETHAYNPGVQSPSIFSQIMQPTGMILGGYLAGR